MPSLPTTWLLITTILGPVMLASNSRCQFLCREAELLYKDVAWNTDLKQGYHVIYFDIMKENAIYHYAKTTHIRGFPGGSVVKNLPANAGDMGSNPGLGWSLGEGYGNPLQYSCLENPMDRGAWWATVHGVSESDIVSDWAHTHTHKAGLS